MKRLNLLGVVLGFCALVACGGEDAKSTPSGEDAVAADTTTDDTGAGEKPDVASGVDVLPDTAGELDSTVDAASEVSATSDVTTTVDAGGCLCGDQNCNPACNEDLSSCPADCKACGDGTCSPGEGPKNCKVDCCGGCGDGKCRGYDCGEDPTSCPQDCGTPCGDGTCQKGENPFNCAADCDKQVCGNRICEPEDNGAKECPVDCAPACGDQKCEGGESWDTCPVDCGYCGDFVCSPAPALGESVATCEVDCTTDVCKKPKACDDGLTCTVDSCNSAGSCQHLADPAFCSDGNICTKDVCGTANDCQHLPAENGQPCLDDSVCTNEEACKDSVCLPGPATTCDDGNACTVDSCNPVKGCKSANAVDGSACDDGVVCTVDSCQAGNCASAPLVCTGNAVCHESTGPDGGCGCEPGYVSVDVDGQPYCAPDFPYWGVRPDSPDPASFKDNGDGTVSDTQAGLMWQKGDSNTGLTWLNAKSYCNNLTQAGKTDWHLPTVAELQTLVDFTKSKPAIATVFGATTASADYWTSLDVPAVTGSAWQVGFANGNTYFDLMTKSVRARCVRPLAPMPPQGARWQVNGDGTYLDKATGVTWTAAKDISTAQSQSAAAAYCSGLPSGCWSLPTASLARSLPDRTKYNPTLNSAALTGLSPTPDAIWTSTPTIVLASAYWYINFYNGYNTYDDGSKSHLAWCSRVIQSCVADFDCNGGATCVKGACACAVP